MQEKVNWKKKSENVKKKNYRKKAINKWINKANRNIKLSEYEVIWHNIKDHKKHVLSNYQR